MLPKLYRDNIICAYGNLCFTPRVHLPHPLHLCRTSPLLIEEELYQAPSEITILPYFSYPLKIGCFSVQWGFCADRMRNSNHSPAPLSPGPDNGSMESILRCDYFINLLESRTTSDMWNSDLLQMYLGSRKNVLLLSLFRRWLILGLNTFLEIFIT